MDAGHLYMIKEEATDRNTESSLLAAAAAVKQQQKLNRSGETPLYCSTERILKNNPHQKVAPDQIRDGIRRITEKYDSLGKMLSQCDNTRNNLKKTPMSDASSDISDVPPSTASTSSTGVSETLSEHDLLQVEMFYKSHKTEVFVCHCQANLYFGSVRQSSECDQWEYAMTGIPLLVLDTGEHHRKRRLHFILAEKGTGFVMWKDVIDHLTKYSAPSSSFHTLHISIDHTKLAGLSFDDTEAAAQFYEVLRQLTSDPNDDILNLSRSKKNKKKEQKPKNKKFKAPRKTDISQPCCFVHVTKLERTDNSGNAACAFKSTLPSEMKHSSSSELSEDSATEQYK
ncbi:uncharacterized protein LOC106867206 [Octopus bimaculoides]|uniref:WH1 domain-containing protein n=1 Tax=Octopus bimaculoides TaxID=37653 RepID=A0A0L8I1Z4_OCTBM|nr:uncharacterized protein LOC106867206 [Octopus bimaculoides]XP_014767500.1 uncharacterized protein LOC106867206 [Octopus bimaculoides]XP_052821536.1 uncharacterized protein LOC106867206 [Octopus bimaculoides]XP_052821537.1 uncharacterized protein LOC106867206 [Octopus bimaculoides]|eukprot:XP_014767499.1 PREDICTED: uncharacterized protein LOC106867206 [Octopus bimaculoides]